MINQSTAQVTSLPGSPSTKSKLPLLFTARPGNVGVQIDAHRALSVPSNSRSAHFTSQFHEMMYENGSLENYARVVERTAQRTRLLHDKMEKLRTREQQFEEEEANRKQRRMQRETARQRRVWQMRQEAKQADEQARETFAAITVQRVIRGALARRIARVLRLAQKTHGAALVLQRAMKVYVSRQQVERERERLAREREEEREREMHFAATIPQQQTRKHLKALDEARRLTVLAALAEDEENDDDQNEERMLSETSVSLVDNRSLDEKILDEALRRGISLDLLFSDSDDSTTLSTFLSNNSYSKPVRPQPPPLNSRRNTTVKRVGGGYRLSLVSDNSKSSLINTSMQNSPEKSLIHTSQRPSQSIENASLDENSRRSRPRAFPSCIAVPVSSIKRSHVSTKNNSESSRSVSPVKGSSAPVELTELHSVCEHSRVRTSPAMQLFTDSQTHYVTVSEDGRIKVWDLANGTLLQELKERDHLSYRYTSLAWTQSKVKSKKRSGASNFGMLAMGTSNGVIVLWDLTTGDVKDTIQTDNVHGSSPVQALVFNTQCSLLYSSSSEKHVLEWNVRTCTLERKFRVGTSGASALAVSADGEVLAAGGSALRTFDLASGKKSRKLVSGLSSAVTKLRFATVEDGLVSSRFLVAATTGARFVNIYDLNLTEHDAPAVTLSLPSSANALFARASLGETVVVKKNKKVKKTKKENEEVTKPIVDLLVGATDSSGSMFLWAHKYQQVNDTSELALASKPLSPTLSTEESAGILLADLCLQIGENQKLDVLVARGSLVKPVFEKVSLVEENAPSQWKKKLEFAEISDALLLKAEQADHSSKSGSKRQKVEAAMDNEKTHVPTLSERRALVNSMAVTDETASFEDLIGVADEEEDELTLAERVEALRERVEGDVTAAISRAERDAETPGKAPGNKPDASSLASVLEQALQARDNALLEYCLRTRDVKIVAKTIARVSASRVLVLLEVIVQKLERSPNRFARLCPWLRAVLLHHTAYLMAQPDLVSSLSALYQLLETRLQVHEQMQKLSGRLALVLGQIHVRNDSNEQEGGKSRATVIYHEGEEEIDNSSSHKVEEYEDEDANENEDQEYKVLLIFRLNRCLIVRKMLLSPTLCRPRHVDPERLRTRLKSLQFDKLIYHEPAVVSTAPMQFQLFALSRDTLFIVPLLGRKGAAKDISLPLRNILSIDRVVPANKKQRDLLLLPTSQLFRLQIQEMTCKNVPSELFVSTFEPHTQLFFQLLRALRIDNQRRLMPQIHCARSTPEKRLELMSLLKLFITELAQAQDDVKRSDLLDELSTAAHVSTELKQLFFEDRTLVSGCVGLAVYLARELSISVRQTETRVMYLLSIMRVFDVMCFDMQLQANQIEMLSMNELASNLLAQGVESFALKSITRKMRKKFMVAQAALLLALDTVQQNEDFRLCPRQMMRRMGENPTSVMLLAIQAPAFIDWLPKFFKTICVAVSRTAIAIEGLKKGKIEKNEWSEEKKMVEEELDIDDEDPLESSEILALWQCVSVLELLVKSDIVLGGKQVCAVLLRTRRDHIDMYLRASRFITALMTSGISHLEIVALKLCSFLEMLQDRRIEYNEE
ncbi:putative IQ motif, EF-hand binding, small-subunit processome, Utp12, WD40-repeat-containing [Plasmopara halstedii]